MALINIFPSGLASSGSILLLAAVIFFPLFYWNKFFLATVSLRALTAKEIRNYTIIGMCLILFLILIFLLSSPFLLLPFLSVLSFHSSCSPFLSLLPPILSLGISLFSLIQ